ncbi:major facilitator superfamily MFS_1 [Paraglaciecola sp. T6c]|uniref:CynX/NimT family MFS transporter n=1 Tax=Pseudoalteromonas atlantica (strain T6c / ATCC BAA-1087) TaxID=3042615 RepID=UPI00005C5AEC|nr:CynX/NimT family MFS transporter [Paraglaciecola sp. T6c]ABG40428.1 major facilitator superfamily MFS_1 [Paraglaciecola sp. T6c]
MGSISGLGRLIPNKIVASSVVLIAGILLVAANLRAPITGIAPILEQIIHTFTLSSTQAGMLTTLPLIAFAVASPMAASLARKIGIESAVFIALIFIATGIGLRLIDSVWMLYMATAVIGVGIAIGNVLLPSLIKRDFPAMVAMMTSCYVLAMGIFSGGFSALVTPLASMKWLQWQGALGVFGLVTLVSIVLWLPRLKTRTMPDAALTNPTEQTNAGSAGIDSADSEQANGAAANRVPPHTAKPSRVWHFSLAWQVTIYLGLNSFMTYVLIGWLPNILVEAGYSQVYAGVLHGWLQFASAVPGFVLIPILARLKDQRVPAVVISLLGAISLLGLLYAPQFAFLWTVLVGFSSGGCFILGLSFISFRSQNALQAASLSGMAQAFGYCLAAVGPMLAGYLYSSLGNWSGSLWMCALASACCALVGLGCGRNRVLPHF